MSESTAAAARGAFSRYSTQCVAAVRQVVGNEVNSNNFLVESESKRFLLKRLSAAKDLGLAVRQLEFQRQLATAGEAVPQTIESREGEILVDETGVRWCLLEFVDGEYFSGRRSQLEPAGRAVGRLLRVCGRAAENDSALPALIYTAEESERLFGEVAASRGSWEHLFDREGAALLADGWDTLAETQAALAGCYEYLGGVQPCHIDLHPHNLLFGGDRVMAFVDFDSYALQPAAVALAFAAFKLVRQYAACCELANDPDTVADAGRAFVETSVEQFPLLADELQRLPLLAKAEVFRRVLIIFRLTLSEGDTSWNHVLSMHIAGLREIDVIFRDVSGTVWRT